MKRRTLRARQGGAHPMTTGAEALDALNEAINAIGARGEGSPT